MHHFKLELFRGMASRLLIAVLIALPLAGCNAWENRAEFAAPEYRWPANYPSPIPANAPPPPVQVRYCYRTLADVDCYAEPKPNRITAYTGVYPNPETLSAEAPYTAPASVQKP